MSETGDKTFDPRHRVVGAVILIGLAVIFVPMILGGRGDREPTTATTTQAASPEKTKTVVIEVAQDRQPTTPAPISTAVSEPVPAPLVPAPSTPQTAAASDAAKPAAQSSASLPAKPAAQSPQSAGKAAQAWFVQVGIFSNAVNARSLAQTLEKHGFKVRLEKVALAKGEGTRVRVGPYTESGAKAAQKRLQDRLKIKGLVRSDQG